MRRPTPTTFMSSFDGTFWRKLTTESLVAIPLDQRPVKAELLSSLLSDILSARYMPDLPRAYLTIDKGHGVARVVPVLSLTDYCAYYYCVKHLQNLITQRRCAGTFGGFRLSNPSRSAEESELEAVLAGHEPPSGIPSAALNPLAWKQEWLRFLHFAERSAQELEGCCVLQFDIANFYDSVNLPTLELDLWQATALDHSFSINLLMCILTNWNRGLDLYRPKSQGVPQDEVGDMSRLLANFYLQGYDQRISDEAAARGARVVRFADDHLILAPNRAIAESILYVACIELHRIGMNVNSSKVRMFDHWADYRQYRAMDLFDLMPNDCTDDDVRAAVTHYQYLVSQSVSFREDSVLKRFMSLGLKRISEDQRDFLLSRILRRDAIRQMPLWWMKSVYAQATRDEQVRFCSELESELGSNHYTSFLYTMRQFYSKEMDRPSIVEQIDLRISEETQRLASRD